MKTITSFLCCLSISLSSIAQFNMPSFKEVVSKFFTEYSYEIYDSYIQFQRKKDGWHIVESTFEDPANYYNPQLYWSKDSGKFNRLNYTPAEGDTNGISEKVNNYLSRIGWDDYQAFQFERNKYFGYPGWAWDIITDSSGPNTFNDTLLESKGRAYSNYSSGFIAEQFGDLFTNNDSDRLSQKVNVKTSNSRINKFLFYESHAIDAYKALYKMNPSYQTRVGNIRIKLANEYMFSYLELMIAGDPEMAMNFAQKADYSDSLLMKGRAYLSDLPHHSILVTSGDNDTYPLWYLQTILKFRPDVTVINYSLLNYRNYLYLLNRNQPQQLFSTNTNEYLKNDYDYFILGNAPDSIVRLDVKSFLTFLSERHNPYDSTEIPYKDGIIRKYYARRLFFETADKHSSKSFEIGNYILLGDYILFDIIQTLRGQNIYFTFNIELLSPLLKKNGEVFELKY